MSTTYLSFASIASLHNNNPLAASVIGELSNKARTYAKDPGVYSLQNNEVVLYNFLSEVDGATVVMPTALANAEITVSQWLYDQAKLGNITGSRANTLSLLRATFTNQIEITDVGEMVSNSQIWLPSFITGRHIVNGADETFYIWFADEYFRTQFQKVTFTIVHPIPLTEMDSLMTMNYQQIEERLRQETPDIIEQRTHDLTEGAAWPYTERNVSMFQIMDLINRPNFNKGYWRIISWGNGVDSEDQLFEQIQNEILANSEYSREEWEEKIPDLFNPLEFYVIPYFDRKGITNRTTGASSQSPIVDRETMHEHVDFYLTPNMTQLHVIKSLQMLPVLYKSFQCAFVAKTNNREGMEKIYSLYPDYQLIPSTDSDFGLMNRETTEFILQLENLLAASEVVTDISLTPAGITRVSRFDKTWVGKRIGRVKLMVLTKWQMVVDGQVET